eukprot:scaffold13205_cov113-Skeletonema_dohrnii-CCMP3373.AAC.1
MKGLAWRGFLRRPFAKVNVWFLRKGVYLQYCILGECRMLSIVLDDASSCCAATITMNLLWVFWGKIS